MRPALPVIVGAMLIAGTATPAAQWPSFRGESARGVRLGSGKGGFSSSPVAAGGRIYFASEDGDLFVVRAGKTFQADAMHNFNETIFATPALDGGLLIVRTRGQLIALGTV